SGREGLAHSPDSDLGRARRDRARTRSPAPLPAASSISPPQTYEARQQSRAQPGASGELRGVAPIDSKSPRSPAPPRAQPQLRSETDRRSRDRTPVSPAALSP